MCFNLESQLVVLLAGCFIGYLYILQPIISYTDPDSDRERLLLRIMVFIVVCSPYVICTVQVVSLSRKRNAGNRTILDSQTHNKTLAASGED